MLSTKNCLRTKDTHRLKVNDPKQIFQANGQEKKAGVVVLISEKIDFKRRKKRPRRSLHNTQGKNPSRRHKHCEYMCTQHKRTEIHKENLGGL